MKTREENDLMVKDGVDKYECMNGKIKRAGNRKGKCDKGGKRKSGRREGREGG